VDYYNKLDVNTPLSDKAVSLKDFVKPTREKNYYFNSEGYSAHFDPERPNKQTNYFYDVYEYTRYFPEDKKILFMPGDISKEPAAPAIVKSRPVSGENTSAVLLNLNKIRHFNFIKDRSSFAEKQDRIVWRGKLRQHQAVRMACFEKLFEHPLCDLGDVGKHEGLEPYAKNRLSIHDQLKYKFIFTLEGNDVATNLKWVLSSNSVAVMPTPRFETWFMEGHLEPDVHYLHVEDDYSNLESKIQEYSAKPEAAEKIIQNANNYVAQFKNQEMEDLISLRVLDKYFSMTGGE